MYRIVIQYHVFGTINVLLVLFFISNYFLSSNVSGNEIDNVEDETLKKMVGILLLHLYILSSTTTITIIFLYRKKN